MKFLAHKAGPRGWYLGPEQSKCTKNPMNFKNHSKYMIINIHIQRYISKISQQQHLWVKETLTFCKLCAQYDIFYLYNL